MVPEAVENIRRGKLRLCVVALNEREYALNPEQEHRRDDRWQWVFTRGAVENCTQNEKCCQRRHDSSHYKLCDERGNVRLNVRKPRRPNSTTRKRKGDSERRKPCEQRLQSQKQYRPKHPFGKASSDDKRRRAVVS